MSHHTQAAPPVTPQVHTSDHRHRANKPPRRRNFIKCEPCRKSHKGCVWPETPGPDSRCQRCRVTDAQCSRPGRKVPSPSDPDPLIGENMRAALLLLSSVRIDCQRLSNRLYPWPVAGLYSWVPPPWPKSFLLRDDQNFSAFISWLNLMIQALDRIERALLRRPEAWSNGGRPDIRRAISVSVAAISPGVQNLSTSRQGDNPMMGIHASAEGYKLLADMVRRLLQSQLSGFEDHLTDSGRLLITIDNAFPPSHIAYENGDTETAVELWFSQLHDPPGTGVGYSDTSVDLLGRTFPQRVAEAGDFSTLQEIWRRVGSSILYANRDGRGMSLFALATCAQRSCDFSSGEIGFLSWLMCQRRAESLHFIWPVPTDLDLALLCGHLDIVRELVGRNLVTEPYSRYTQKAIELGRADMAFCFLPGLSDSTRSNRYEIDLLICAAQQKLIELQSSWELACRVNQSLAADIASKLCPFEMLVKSLQELVVMSPLRSDMLADTSRPIQW